ncbi:MAG: M28 family peptidase [Promethearchaeota archaeon]
MTTMVASTGSRDLGSGNHLPAGLGLAMVWLVVVPLLFGLGSLVAGVGAGVGSVPAGSAGTGGGQPAPAGSPAAGGEDLDFSPENAYGNLSRQLTFGGSTYRVPGTQGRDDCRDYIEDTLAPLANVTTHHFQVQGVDCYNVLGKINEGGNASGIVVLGAHYDTRAIAEKDPLESNRDKPIPGANDGASGVAVLLELARVLHLHSAELTRQVWLVFFDAEDQGGGAMSGWGWCEGSERFVQEIDQFFDPGESTASIDEMVLLDMVGGTNLEFVLELNSDQGMRVRMFQVGHDLGYTGAFPASPKYMRVEDDHVPFVDAGVPALALIVDFSATSDPEWHYHHTLEDDLDHVDIQSLEITGKTVEAYFRKYFWSGAGGSAGADSGGGSSDGGYTLGYDVAGSPTHWFLAWAGVGVVACARAAAEKRREDRH